MPAFVFGFQYLPSSPGKALLAIAALLLADEDFLGPGTHIRAGEMGDFHVTASRRAEEPDQQIHLSRGVLLKCNNLPIPVGFGVALAILQPVALLHVQLRLKPLVKERHDTHHLSVHGLRDVLSHEFVAELQHIVPAELVHVGLADDLQERGEETPAWIEWFCAVAWRVQDWRGRRQPHR